MGKSNSFSGRTAWTVDKGQLTSKLKVLLVYFCLFMGVGLISYGVNSPRYAIAALGLVLAVLGALYRDKVQVSGVLKKVNSDKSKELKKYFLRVLMYSLSALGVGFTIGSWLFIDKSFSYFAVYFVAGVILSFVARYNPKKHRVMAMLEDYFIYFLIYAGVAWVSYGIFILVVNPIFAVFLIIAGTIASSSLFLLRERFVFKRVSAVTLRNFIAVIALVLGFGLVLNSLVLFLAPYMGYPNTAGYLAGSLFFVYGSIVVLGGALIYDGRTLVNVKDLL